MKIFGLYDKVAERFVSTTIAESEQMFVRSCFAAIVMDYPIRDVEFYCLGTFEPELGLINPCVPRLCSWDCYKFPEKRNSKDKFLEKEQIIKMAQEKKQKFIQETKDSIIDLERFLSQIKAQLQLEEEKPKKDKQKIKELRQLINQTSTEIQNLKGVKNE